MFYSNNIFSSKTKERDVENPVEFVNKINIFDIFGRFLGKFATKVYQVLFFKRKYIHFFLETQKPVNFLHFLKKNFIH